jgi:hypothetical protein
MLISGSDDNSITHGQEVQGALIDEFIIEGEALLQVEPNEPVLEEEDEEESILIPLETITSKIMVGGIEYDNHNAKKTILDMAEQVLCRKGDIDGLSTDER